MLMRLVIHTDVKVMMVQTFFFFLPPRENDSDSVLSVSNMYHVKYF